MGGGAPLVTAQTPSVTVQLLPKTLTLRQQVSPRPPGRRRHLPVCADERSSRPPGSSEQGRRLMGKCLPKMKPATAFCDLRPSACSA